MNFFNVVCSINDTRFALHIGWPLPLYPHFPLDVGLHCYPYLLNLSISNSNTDAKKF